MGLLNKIGQIFGLKGGEKPQTYGGTRPYSSLKEIPEGKLYADTLTQRLAGQGVGYSPDFLSYNAPYAKQRMETLQNYEMPVISSQATARGLGRSSIPVNRAALSTQEASRDIESRIAQMSLQNEEQKRQEINDALTKLGGFTSAEAGQQAGRAGFDYGDYNSIQAQRQANNAAQLAGLKNLIGTGASMISGGMTGGLTGALGAGAGAMGGIDNAAILAMIQKLRGQGLVNVGQ